MLRKFSFNFSLSVIIPVSCLMLLIFILTNFFIKRGDYLESISRLKQTAKNVRITADPQNLEIISASSNN
nr:hypothetical protein [Spirochaetota bacterium]